MFCYSILFLSNKNVDMTDYIDPIAKINFGLVSKINKGLEQS